MAGAASFKGAIQMGLVLIPITAKSAVKEHGFAFNNHCAAHEARVKQVITCSEGGETLLSTDIVKGYNGHVGVDEAFIDGLKQQKSPILTVDGFVPSRQIDPRFYQKSYDVTPGVGGQKGYLLLLAVMTESGKVALGRVIMGQKQYTCILRPFDGAIAMELLYWPDEVGKHEPIDLGGATISDGEMALGRQLVASMETSFDPERLHDDYAERVGAYLADFVAGKQSEATVEQVEPKQVIPDLMATLVAAVAEMKGREAA